MKRVAINGFGRIGRAVFKLISEETDLEVVAINDLLPADALAYLLQFDTVYGRYPSTVIASGDTLLVGDASVFISAEKDPEKLPWRDLDIDIVVESTGFFTKMEKAKAHLVAGAKKVVISAPTKSPELATAVYGVAHPESSEPNIFSCASCTTNSIAPVAEVMARRVGVKKAILTTIHAYTASHQIVDLPSNKKRFGRAAAQNIIPATTGAAIATTKVLPQLSGKFDGTAVRVPVAVGSLSDITFVTERPVSKEEINEIFKEEAATQRYKQVLAVNEEEIVSSDIIGNPHAAIVDLTLTQIVDGDLVKIFAWYDNEWGYSNQLVREIKSSLGLQ